MYMNHYLKLSENITLHQGFDNAYSTRRSGNTCNRGTGLLSLDISIATCNSGSRTQVYQEDDPVYMYVTLTHSKC
jgi:hypothetical protein